MEISTPNDFVRIWTETLRLLDEADLLDCVVWVDLCNEFLLKEWCPMVYTEIFGGDPTQEFGEEDFATFVGELSDERRQKVNAFFTKSIEGVRASYPELLYTFSNQSFGETHFLNGDVSELDLVEPHIWTTDDMAWSSEINYFNALGGDFPDEHLKMYRTAEKLFELDPKRVEDILEGRMTIWADWAKQHNKPLITTEGWTTVVYEDFSHNGFLGEWNWFKEVAEIAVDKAIAKGWQGICTSNFAEPHFEGMWYDVEWHKKLTSRIKDGE